MIIITAEKERTNNWLHGPERSPESRGSRGLMIRVMRYNISRDIKAFVFLTCVLKKIKSNKFDFNVIKQQFKVFEYLIY